MLLGTKIGNNISFLLRRVTKFIVKNAIFNYNHELFRIVITNNTNYTIFSFLFYTIRYLYLFLLQCSNTLNLSLRIKEFLLYKKKLRGNYYQVYCSLQHSTIILSRNFTILFNFVQKSTKRNSIICETIVLFCIRT